VSMRLTKRVASLVKLTSLIKSRFQVLLSDVLLLCYDLQAI